MYTNIIELIKNTIGTHDVHSYELNESSHNLPKAVEAIVPSVLIGILNKLNLNGSAFWASLNTQTQSATSQINEVPNIHAVQHIFGEQTDTVVNEISNYADITPMASKGMLAIYIEKILNVITQYLGSNSTNYAAIKEWLISQKDNILDALPATFNLGSALGISNLNNLFATSNTRHNTNIFQENIHNQQHTLTSPEKKGGGFWWILLLLIAGLLIGWLVRGCNKEPERNNVIITPISDTSISTTSYNLDENGNYIYDVGDITQLKLNDGTILKVGNNSTEWKLVDFLKNGTIDTDDKTKNWITLDRVYFQTGESMLTTTSQVQIENIAKILINYPSAIIKLGGYTDNIGDVTINTTISIQRAKAVADLLMVYGVAAHQIDEAEGYGAEFPISTNDTEEGRAQNRRVDLKVSKK
jgi:OOP family OmpA-OmpF porin